MSCRSGRTHVRKGAPERRPDAEGRITSWAMNRKDVRAVLKGPDAEDGSQAYFILTDAKEFDGKLSEELCALEADMAKLDQMAFEARTPGSIFQLPRSAYLKIEDLNAYRCLYQVSQISLQTPPEDASSGEPQ